MEGRVFGSDCRTDWGRARFTKLQCTFRYSIACFIIVFAVHWRISYLWPKPRLYLSLGLRGEKNNETVMTRKRVDRKPPPGGGVGVGRRRRSPPIVTTAETPTLRPPACGGTRRSGDDSNGDAQIFYSALRRGGGGGVLPRKQLYRGGLAADGGASSAEARVLLELCVWRRIKHLSDVHIRKYMLQMLGPISRITLVLFSALLLLILFVSSSKRTLSRFHENKARLWENVSHNSADLSPRCFRARRHGDAALRRDSTLIAIVEEDLLRS